MCRTFFFIILFSLQALGGQVVEEFTDTTHRDTQTTGVWNAYFGYAHPPIATDPTTSNGADNELAPATDVGDGSDGAFDTTTYSRFSVGGDTTGNVITINTDTRPVLNLTYFYLASGWTIQGAGSQPLWIKVLGTFVNYGTINCSGGDGASTNSSVVTQPAGGTGRCGGGSGGSGGYSGGASTQGSSGCTVPACTITGGSGGTTQVTNAGGGGGGGGYYSATAGNNGGPTGGGAGGTSQLDASMTKFSTLAGGPGGGSGGGGGGYSSVTGPSSGAGGGAGGGFIRISSVGDFANYGSILARGGNGGSESGSDRAGAGGGGAGGSIWIQTAGSINNTGGTINALGGSGGSIVSGTGTGGNGASGRTWLVYGKTFTGASENPVVNMGDPGEIHFSETSYILQSKAYDTRNTYPTYTSFSINANLPGSSTATIQVAGSSDGFVSDDTGFVSTANLDTLRGKRFFKFKVTFQYLPLPANSMVNPIPTPLLIYSVTANFDGIKQTEYSYYPACGKISGPGEFILLFITLLFLRFLFPLHSKPEEQV